MHFTCINVPSITCQIGFEFCLLHLMCYTCVQGRRFSVPGLLADEDAAQPFEHSSVLIFRLAPQARTAASNRRFPTDCGQCDFWSSTLCKQSCIQSLSTLLGIVECSSNMVNPGVRNHTMRVHGGFSLPMPDHRTL